MALKIFLFLLVVGLVSYIEIKKMKKENMKKELIIYSLLLLFSSSLFILKQFEVSMINPLNGIKIVFEPLGKVVESVFTSGG